jgi:tetratricopeptide (TPR) repeat protein
LTDSTDRRLRVFLCYASADRSAVRELYFYLMRQPGIEPWMDQESLLPGQNWKVEINKELSESDVIIICLSKISIHKESYVQKEIAIALDKALEKPVEEIFIIPAKFEECDLPTNLEMYHSVDLFREDDYKHLMQNHERLMKSLRKRAAKLGIAVAQASEGTKQTGFISALKNLLSLLWVKSKISNDSSLPEAENELEWNKSQKGSKAKEGITTNIPDLLANAGSAYSSTEYDKAIELYKQVLVLSPKNKYAQQYLRKTEELKRLIENADDAYYVAEYDKAIQLYKQVLDSDPDNKHAEDQIRKAERSRTSKNAKTEELPTEAMGLYRRSRAFIAVGDLTGAIKLLKRAIDIAEKARVDFLNAKSLLENIQNALKAEELKKRAFEELETQQWVKTETSLKSALALDPTDDAVQTLLLHLHNLIKAQNLIKNLNAGNVETGNRSIVISEIRKIIKLTNETTELSKLWQDVVRLFGEYNGKNIIFQNGNMVFRSVILVILSTSMMLLITFWFLYLYPRHRIDVNCDSVAPGLEATLNYPFYVANEDVEKIEIAFKNTGNSEFSGPIKINFEGTAKVKYAMPSKSNVIEIESLVKGGERLETFYFSVDGATTAITSPWYINFSVGACVPEAPYTPEDLHVAMAPIPKLRAIWLWISGGSGTITFIVALFREKIINVFFKKEG